MARSSAPGAEPGLRSLHDHVALWRRRAVVIMVSMVAAAFMAGVVSLLQPVRYQATIEVLVPIKPPTDLDATQQLLAQRVFDPNRAMQDEAKLATSAAVTDATAAKIGRPVSLTARTVKDTDVVALTATADTADGAAEAANAAAAAYAEARARGGDGQTRATPSVLAAAKAPSSASQPATARNLVVGALAGLVAGVVLAYVVDALDDRIRSVDDLERLVGLPALGRVTATDGAVAARAVGLDHPQVRSLVQGLSPATTASAATVLVVPEGSRARDIDRVERLDLGLGDTPVAAVLETRDGAPIGDGPPPPAA